MTLSRAHLYLRHGRRRREIVSIFYTITQTPGNASSHAEYYDRADPKPTPNVTRLTWSGLPAKTNGSLRGPLAHMPLSTEFCENRLSSFSLILLTNTLSPMKT